MESLNKSLTVHIEQNNENEENEETFDFFII